MKNYPSKKYAYFIFSIVFLSFITSLFFWADTQHQSVSPKKEATDAFAQTPPAQYAQEPQYSKKIDSNLVLEKVSKKANRGKLHILNDWKVRGWRLICPIEPMLNEWETGKAVFKIKINDNGRLVAIEPLLQLSTLSEENIQSFKTSIELDLEGCIERKEVKLEAISSGTITFFVSKP
ncbi:MAG: hypothetical protein SFU27_09525 [Thermonemataceae bacterium]|nr:hypothetical protein [Thermonemataceae bacterium]